MKPGKVIVLTGPKSSGKTSLMKALIKSEIINFVTISKKRIVMESMISIGEKEDLKDLINTANQLLNRKVSLFALYYFDYPALPSELISKIKETADTYFEEFLSILYTNYIANIRRYTDLGQNVIIDDTLLYFRFDKFYNYRNGLEIKRLLLYDSMEGLLRKCNIRNEKFIRLLQQADNIEEFQANLAAKEAESNDSGSSLRDPIDIIKDYTDFYRFEKSTNSKEVILDQITHSEMNKYIDIIYETQEELEEILKENKYPIDSHHKEKKYYKSLVEEYFEEEEMCFILPKFKTDFIQMAKQISNIGLLGNRQFLLYFFKDIKNWLEDEINITIFLQEWSLWSKYYGKVLVINGISSSGKTTLAKALMQHGFNHISEDNIFLNLFYNELETVLPFIRNIELLTKREILAIFDSSSQPYKEYNIRQLEQIAIIKQKLSLIDQSLINNIHISSKKIIEQMFLEVQRYIGRGENVVIDTVMVHKSEINEFFGSFNYPFKLILLYTPLGQVLINCFSRPIDDYRFPSKIIHQFMNMYQVEYNGSLGMPINKEEILSVFEYIKNNLKERFGFLPQPQLLSLQEETEGIMERAQLSLENYNEVFISLYSAYDVVITIPQLEITDQLLKVLIHSTLQTDNNLKTLDFTGWIVT